MLAPDLTTTAQNLDAAKVTFAKLAILECTVLAMINHRSDVENALGWHGRVTAALVQLGARQSGNVAALAAEVTAAFETFHGHLGTTVGTLDTLGHGLACGDATATTTQAEVIATLAALRSVIGQIDADMQARQAGILAVFAALQSDRDRVATLIASTPVNDLTETSSDSFPHYARSLDQVFGVWGYVMGMLDSLIDDLANCAAHDAASVLQGANLRGAEQVWAQLAAHARRRLGQSCA